jgi:hypothetical protein
MKIRATLLASLALLASQAHALTAGDLTFTSFNADEDGWSVATFVDLAPNTLFYFTDNEWNGSAIGAGGAFNTGESFHQWNTGASVITAGTVVRFSSVDTTSLAASAGTLSRAAVSGSTNYGISQTADTVYLYQGASAAAPTVFLSAVSSGLFSVAEGQLANTGLTAGVNAVKLKNSSDFGQYSGARAGAASMAAYKPLVGDVSNWQDGGEGAYATTVPNTTAFTAAVPEPESVPLALAGIAVMGLLGRRRLAR